MIFTSFACFILPTLWHPIVGATGDLSSYAGGRNGYGYVGENPETRTDPTGHVIVGEGQLGQPAYAWRTNDGGLKVVQYFGNYGPPIWNQYTPVEVHRYDPYWKPPTVWDKIKDSLGITNIEHTFNKPHASFWDKVGAVAGAVVNDVNNLALAGTILFGGAELAGAEGGWWERKGWWREMRDCLMVSRTR